jgi:hypothetical protein
LAARTTISLRFFLEQLNSLLAFLESAKRLTFRATMA